MNPHTGHLINIDGDEEMARALRHGYEVLPEELQAAAKLKLAGQPEAQVNLHSRSPLADWARKKRKEKIAAKSRRANRRKS